MRRFRFPANCASLVLLAVVAVAEILSSRPLAQTLTDREAEHWGITGSNPLEMPAAGDHALRVLSPLVLELTLITTKQPDAKVEQWDFVSGDGALRLPETKAFAVTVDGTAWEVKAVKARP